MTNACIRHPKNAVTRRSVIFATEDCWSYGKVDYGVDEVVIFGINGNLVDFSRLLC